MLRDAGYATPAAMVFSLALALIATAFVARSAALVRLTRADLGRQALEYALDGAQLDAVAQVIRSGPGGPYHWAFPSDAGWLDAVAERESLKLPPARAAQLPDHTFDAFGVTDATALKARLTLAASAKDLVDIAGLDAAPLWRRCAPSAISSLGEATALQGISRAAPHLGDLNPTWRVAEVWRVSLTTSAGWRDDRIVRFTGDALHPAAVVSRRFGRDNGGQGICDSVLASIG